MKRTMSWLLVLAMLFTLAASFAEQAESAETLPAAFDLRSVDTDGDGVGDRCYVPPVRLQAPFGSCWGFAATAASEISILGSILDYDPDAWKTINLSEKQMVYFSHVPLADENNPFQNPLSGSVCLRNQRRKRTVSSSPKNWKTWKGKSSGSVSRSSSWKALV